MIKPIELLGKVISGAKFFDRSLQTHLHDTVINTEIHELEEYILDNSFIHLEGGISPYLKSSFQNHSSMVTLRFGCPTAS